MGKGKKGNMGEKLVSQKIDTLGICEETGRKKNKGEKKTKTNKRLQRRLGPVGTD